MINKTYDIKPDLSNISMAIIKKLNQVIDHLNARDIPGPEKKQKYCCHAMNEAIMNGNVVMEGILYTTWRTDDGNLWNYFSWCPFCGSRLNG